MKEISLTRGLVALVDDEDFEELSRYKWFANCHGYATRRAPDPTGRPRRIDVLMHRFLLGLEYGDRREGDHRDLNRQNNQRYNLRISTKSQNGANKRAMSTNTSGYKGVCWDKKSSKWRAQINVRGEKKHLGAFESAKLAHEAYCVAATMYHGEFANFGNVT